MSLRQSARRLTSRAGLYSLRPGAFGEAAGEADMRLLQRAKLCFFGEIHSQPAAVELQCRTVQAMLGSMATPSASSSSSSLHIVFEHFNFEMQPLLDDFSAGRLSLDELAAGASPEGHDVLAYEPLLSLTAARSERVVLHAGFIPRSYARIVMRESLDAALTAAKERGYVAMDEACDATDAHYSYFESLLTGRDLHDPAGSNTPTDQYRRMFPAQVIKDAAMAHKINTLLDGHLAIGTDDKILVICGIGHSGYNHGVPERVFQKHPEVEKGSYRIWTLPLETTAPFESEGLMKEVLTRRLGAPGKSNPADLCLAFCSPLEEEEEEEEEAAAGEEAATAKAATAEAYNAVGATAGLRGNLERARLIMARLGYTEGEIDLAGSDGYNFQGVGCPHRLVSLQSGERVLDLGSGLGIDSLIASHAVGPTGSVSGLDLAEREVRHAQSMATKRGLPESHLSFQTGDLERIGEHYPPESFDAVISNGAFCLVPDKPKAFQAVYDVLKPGGRFAVCTSTVIKPLEVGVTWPLCMQMFIEKKDLQPLCEAIGFDQVYVDDRDPLMQFELPGLVEEEQQQEEQQEAAPASDGQGETKRRNQVHVGSAEFRHLADFDMNEICARVVVTGVKPTRG